jgi:hypothetical protein
MSDPLNLQRGDEPSEAAERHLKKAIARAKRKGSARVRPGDMEGTPRLDALEDHVRMQPAPGADSPPSELSSETARGLEAMARSAEQGSHEDAEPPEEGLPEQKAPEVPLTENQRLRKAIEGRVRPIDIGQFLMNGVVAQAVPIIDSPTARLVVVFQTAKESLEVYVDSRLAEEAAQIRQARDEAGRSADVEMSQREYIRRQNEWALASHVKSYGGKDWPAPVRANGDVDPEAMQLRLRKVRELPSPVFAMVTQNLGWFIERVGEALTSAALGNG